VAIDVRKVHSHRKETGLPDGAPPDGAKSSLAVVDPDPIRRLKVITDVKVGRPVAIEISEHGGQAPVIGRADGLAVFTEEGSVGPASRHKARVAGVVKENVRFAVFQDAATIVETEPTGQVRRRSRAAVH